MAGRPTPTGRHPTKRHDHDTEKNKKKPNAQEKIFEPTHLAHLVFPDTQPDTQKTKRAKPTKPTHHPKFAKEPISTQLLRTF